jgi:hypothetical protein
VVGHSPNTILPPTHRRRGRPGGYVRPYKSANAKAFNDRTIKREIDAYDEAFGFLNGFWNRFVNSF